MHSITDYLNSKGIAPNAMLHTTNGTVMLRDIIKEYAEGVVDEAAEVRELEHINLPGGAWRVSVNKQSILNTKNKF